ncbi:MAG TPA: hypothetical protein VMF06_13105 [Candidatus Limnocylindria bacterium]|jgi:hypothetical protein|nr:hypothetical protein [Candidatus Limnocylindria bacterium]
MRILRNSINTFTPGRGLKKPAVRRIKAAAAARSTSWREAVRADFVDRFAPVLPARLLERTLTEAEALAFTTPVPELVFAGLAEEKLTAASQWLARQQDVWERSSESFAA